LERTQPDFVDCEANTVLGRLAARTLPKIGA